MDYSNELDKLFCSSEMLAGFTGKSSSSVKTIGGKKVLTSRKSKAYFRSIIAEPSRNDLSVGEYTEYSMLHRRLRTSGYVSDFSGLSLASLREKAIWLELDAAVRCSF